MLKQTCTRVTIILIAHVANLTPTNYQKENPIVHKECRLLKNFNFCNQKAMERKIK